MGEDEQGIGSALQFFPRDIEPSYQGSDDQNALNAYMSQYAGQTTTPDESDSGENYSHEGRNYPTEESTQGSGGSPVNASMSGGFDFSKFLSNLKGQFGGIGQKVQDNPLQSLLFAALAARALTGGNRPTSIGGYTGPGINMGLKATRSPIAPINYQPYSGRPVYGPQSSQVTYAAHGGLLGLAQGKYLRGNTDGMADKIDTSIDDQQPAKLSHGEFVVPADVVSHLGNGNSDAGADVLYKMMDKVRMARTGRKQQGKRINPNRFMPGGSVEDAKYASGGNVKGYADGGTTTTTPTGSTTAQNLSSWAGPYVTDYLSKGQALASTPYQSFTDWSGGNVPLTAGTSPLQQQAYQGLSSLTQGTNANFDTASQFATQAGVNAQNQSYTPQNISAPSLQNYQMQQPTDVVGQSYGGATLGAAPTMQGQVANAATLNPYTSGTAATGQAAISNYLPNLQMLQMGSVAPVQAASAGVASLGAAPTMEAARLGEAPEMTAARLGVSPEAQAALNDYVAKLQSYQMGPAERVGTQSMLEGPGIGAYMSPYMQNVVDRQQAAAQRQADIQAQARKAQFAQAGAFGGGRFGIENAQANAALLRQQGDIQAQGLQSAYQQAQQQFNTEQQARLQAALANQQAGLTVGQQNLAANLAVQQLGTQTGLQAALANQQAKQQTALANQALAGQYGLQQGQFEQAAASANQAMKGQYGLTQAQYEQAARAANQALAGQYGLTGAQLAQSAYNTNAQLAQQAGLANQQMQYNTGLQNLNAALGVQSLGANLGQQMALANLGNEQQMGLANLGNQQAVNMANQQAANQFALTQAGYNQQANLQTAAQAQQAAAANQALAGQYGLTQAGYQQAAGLQEAQLAQQAALANQQAGLTTGQQNLAANLGVQNLAAQQNLQAQLANQQAGQFGANFGLQSNQQQLAAAQALAGIGQGQFGTQLSGLQALLGAGTQQQQTEQAGIQALQNEYNKQMMYPYQQLQFQQGLLSGLPVAAATNTPNTSPLENLGLTAKQLTGLMSLFGGK